MECQDKVNSAGLASEIQAESGETNFCVQGLHGVTNAMQNFLKSLGREVSPAANYQNLQLRSNDLSLAEARNLG